MGGNVESETETVERNGGLRLALGSSILSFILIVAAVVLLSIARELCLHGSHDADCDVLEGYTLSLSSRILSYPDTSLTTTTVIPTSDPSATSHVNSSAEQEVGRDLGVVQIKGAWLWMTWISIGLLALAVLATLILTPVCIFLHMNEPWTYKICLGLSCCQAGAGLLATIFGFLLAYDGVTFRMCDIERQCKTAKVTVTSFVWGSVLLLVGAMVSGATTVFLFLYKPKRQARISRKPTDVTGVSSVDEAPVSPHKFIQVEVPPASKSSMTAVVPPMDAPMDSPDVLRPSPSGLTSPVTRTSQYGSDRTANQSIASVSTASQSLSLSYCRSSERSVSPFRLSSEKSSLPSSSSSIPDIPLAKPSATTITTSGPTHSSSHTYSGPSSTSYTSEDYTSSNEDSG